MSLPRAPTLSPRTVAPVPAALASSSPIATSLWLWQPRPHVPTSARLQQSCPHVPQALLALSPCPPCPLVPLTRLEGAVGVAAAGQLVLAVIGLPVGAVTPGQATLQVGLHDALHRCGDAVINAPLQAPGALGSAPCAAPVPQFPRSNSTSRYL